MTFPPIYKDYEGLVYALVVIFIIAAAFLLSRFLKFLLQSFYKIGSNVLKIDITQFKFVLNAINWVIGFLAVSLIIYTIPAFRAVALTIFAGAGILAAIIGLASQQAFSNIVSGIFVVIFKPFRVDDVIQIGTDLIGTVEDITLRHTVIRNFENRRIIIPNSKISTETIINATISDPKICRHFEMQISYESDVDLAIAIMQEEAMKHPNCIDNRTPEEKEQDAPIVLVRVVGFTDSAVRVRANVWSVDNPASFTLFCDLNRSVKKRFDAEGIEIPYPHRTLVVKEKKTDGAQVAQLKEKLRWKEEPED